MAAAVPPYDEKLESWECYQERLENYFIAMDIADPNKKKAILLNSVGPGTYERVRNICYPSSVNDRLYEELLEVFSRLFTPAVVIFKERKTFYAATKKKNEKAVVWHERICRLAINCKFGIYTEEILRDKFVTSFEGPVFEKFCNAGSNLTLTQALDIANVYETIDVVPNPKPFPKNPAKDRKEKESPQKKKQDHGKEDSKSKRSFPKKKPEDK